MHAGGAWSNATLSRKRKEKLSGGRFSNGSTERRSLLGMISGARAAEAVGGGEDWPLHSVRFLSDDAQMNSTRGRSFDVREASPSPTTIITTTDLTSNIFSPSRRKAPPGVWSARSLGAPFLSLRNRHTNQGVRVGCFSYLAPVAQRKGKV